MPGPEDIVRAIRGLAKKRVLVGIPADKDARPDEPIGNAALGYIHEHGSPARNIPARPHLVPGVEAALPEITRRLEAAAKAAMAGEAAQVEQYLGQAGQAAVNSVQRLIQAGIPPPLAQATVNRRRIRTPGSSYRRLATRPEDTTPLIDTATYIRSLTWVIREG